MPAPPQPLAHESAPPPSCTASARRSATTCTCTRAQPKASSCRPLTEQGATPHRRSCPPDLAARGRAGSRKTVAEATLTGLSLEAVATSTQSAASAALCCTAVPVLGPGPGTQLITACVGVRVEPDQSIPARASVNRSRKSSQASRSHLQSIIHAQRTLPSGRRPSLRHTTRTVPPLSHEHWYKNWGGVSGGAVSKEPMQELLGFLSRET